MARITPWGGSLDGAVGVRRIAVFRALQIGDLLCSVPALRALRARFSQARITLIGLPWARDFAARFSAYVDDFIEFPGYPGLPEREPELRRIPAFLAHARAQRFDLALQLHGSGEITNPLVALLGASRIAGLSAPGGYRPDPDLFVDFVDADHEIRRLLRVPRHLGAPNLGEALEFPVRDADWRELGEIPEAFSLLSDAFVCIHPGSRCTERRWPPRAFAAAADGIASLGYRVAITGTTAERDVVDAVAHAMRAPAASLACDWSFGAMAALISRASLLVANDTAVSHVAAALRTPSVVVFTGSDPERWAPLDRGRHRVVDARKTDPGPSRVLSHAAALLAASADQAAG